MTHCTRNRKPYYALAAMLGAAILSGCSAHTVRSSSSQPLNAIIEPPKDSRQVLVKQSLTFPASVAVVAIPSKGQEIPRTLLRDSADLLKEQLLPHSKYIRTVNVVSPDDLNGKISLEQIRALYDADIAIILSYEQDQASKQSGPAGLIDGTIIGAFLAPTVTTQTSTDVDAKIVHIPSNALIFRQSGRDRRSLQSTSYGREGAAAQDARRSILAATEDLGNSLAQTLTRFDNFDPAQAVSMNVLMTADGTNGPAAAATDANWNKVDSFKYSGGGSFDPWTLLVGTPLVWLAHRRRPV